MSKTYTVVVESKDLIAELDALIKSPGLEYILKRGAYDYNYRKARSAGQRADAKAWKSLTAEQKARIMAETKAATK